MYQSSFYFHEILYFEIIYKLTFRNPLRVILVAANKEKYLSHSLHRCWDVVDEVFLRHFLTDIAITPQIVLGDIQ